MSARAHRLLDYAHIGNARPGSSSVRRAVSACCAHLYGADHVTYARNITDVDDKINARAARDYPDLAPKRRQSPKVTAGDRGAVSRPMRGRSAASRPSIEPRATEHIAEIAPPFIDRLIRAPERGLCGGGSRSVFRSRAMESCRACLAYGSLGAPLPGRE